MAYKSRSSIRSVLTFFNDAQKSISHESIRAFFIKKKKEAFHFLFFTQVLSWDPRYSSKKNSLMPSCE